MSHVPPGTEIIREDATHYYLYARAYSDVLGFIDYLEVLVRPQPETDSGDQRLAVRLAAMPGKCSGTGALSSPDVIM